MTLLYYPSLIWPGNVTHIGKVKDACRILVGGPERRRPLGGRRREWEGDIGVDIWEGVDWSQLAQDADV